MQCQDSFAREITVLTALIVGAIGLKTSVNKQAQKSRRNHPAALETNTLFKALSMSVSANISKRPTLFVCVALAPPPCAHLCSRAGMMSGAVVVAVALVRIDILSNAFGDGVKNTPALGFVRFK